MEQWVTEVELGGLGWEPNAPGATMITDDSGVTVLAIRAHPDDPDRRCVVLVWQHTDSASSGGPNDERIEQHPLFDRGLADVLWFGTVEPAPPGLRHHILPLKERVIEVVARDLRIHRFDGSTVEAAVDGLWIRADPAARPG